MSISVTNATRGVVKNFKVIQPQFWYAVAVSEYERPYLSLMKVIIGMGEQWNH
jgi:hypothetical protein